MYNAPSQSSRYLVLTSAYLTPLILIVIAALSGYILFFSPVFAAQVFLCERDNTPCGASSATAELERLKGQNLFLLNESILEARLATADQSLQAVTATKILPHTLSVQLTSVSATFALVLQGTDQFVLLDNKLNVLSLGKGEPGVASLFVTSLPPLSLGQPPQGELLPAASLGLQLSSSHLPVKSMRLESGILQVMLQGGQFALLDPTGDIPRQLSLLQAVLGNRTIIEGIETIDVRYSQPILK